MKKNTRSSTISIPFVLLMLFAIVGSAGHGDADVASEHENQNLHVPEAQKILYVASYNTKNPWSGGIKAGIESALTYRKNIEFRVMNMDTLGVQSEEKKKQAALMAKQEIDFYKPDVVITSDDNAAKYLIVPYYSNSSIPFVFCGINWNASQYRFPSKNVTGMIEVQLIDQLVGYLSPYAKGNRIGSLRSDTMTNRNEAQYLEQQLGATIKTIFVKDITEWKKQFVQLQNKVDIILLGDIDTLEMDGESKDDVEQFIYDNTKIPTGHWDAWFKKNALITLATIPEEQGEYAGHTALEILEGKSPSDIPLVKNKKAKIFLNMKFAKKLGIIFPLDLIESASIVPAD